MAKNITLLGANYPDVPAVDLPQTGGGTARFIDVDSVGNVRVFYGTCATAEATQRKDVTISEVTALQTGDVFVITFTYRQYYNGVPTLRINSLTAANIRRVTGTNAARYEWQAGETITFVWDGTYFLILNGGFATTSYYGRAKLASSATSDSEGMAATARALNRFSQYSISGVAVYSASATYAVGDRVRYGYYTYECIIAITTAEAWNAEHWIALDPIQAQIDSIRNSIAFSGADITGANGWTWPAKARKSGNVVNLGFGLITNTTAITTGAWTKIGRLPSEYTPDNTVYFVAYDDTNDKTMEGRIKTDGDILVYANSAAKSIALNVTFIVV